MLFLDKSITPIYEQPPAGASDKLEVLGVVSKDSSGKVFLVRCSTCAEDSELNGDGMFTIYSHNLAKGVLPCSCSKQPRYTSNQWAVKLSRAADVLKLNYIDSFRVNGKLRVTLSCEAHGEYTTSAPSLLSGRGCSSCGMNSKHKRKPDNEMTQSFLRSNKFAEGTLFERSDKKDSKGAKVYWKVTCGDCEGVYESSSSHLQRGKLGCVCAIKAQKTAYLIQYTDVNETTVAVKFGITSNLDRRLKEHSVSSSYDVNLLEAYTFGTSISCKQAELFCKRNFLCGVLSKEVVPDGWSETTYSYNIDNILSVFRAFGGERLDAYC